MSWTFGESRWLRATRARSQSASRHTMRASATLRGWTTGTLIYSATAEDGSGDWLYAVDVEHRIPHRVSSGIAEQYMSVAVSNTHPRRVLTTIAVPTSQLWQVPIADTTQAEHAAMRLPVSTTRSFSPRFAPTFLVFLSSKGGANGLWKFENGETTEIICGG